MPNLQSGLIMRLTRNLQKDSSDVTVYVDTLPTIDIPSEGLIALIETPGVINTTGDFGPEWVKITAKDATPNRLTVVRAIDPTTLTPTQNTSYLKAHNAGTKIFLVNHHSQYSYSWIGRPTINSSLPTTGNNDKELRFVSDLAVLKYWDQGTSNWIALAAPTSASDASSTVKGITKLSINPALATNPIAVGTNDPRVTSQLSLVQTETTGSTLSLARNLSSASTDAAVLSVIQQNSGDDQSTLTITQAGTGDGIRLIVSGVLGPFVHGVFAYSDAIQVNTPAFVRFFLDNSSSTIDLLNITNDGTGSSIVLEVNGVLASGKRGLYIYSNAAQTNSNLFYLHSDNASSSADVATIINDGTGSLLTLNQTTLLTSAKHVLSLTNSAAQTGSSRVLDVNQTNSSASAIMAELTNSGTNSALKVDIAGTLSTNSIGVDVISNIAQTSTGASLFRVYAQNTSNTKTLQTILNEGTGISLFIDVNNASQSSAAINIDTEQSNDSPIINVDVPGGTAAFQVYHNTDVDNDLLVKIGGNRYWTDSSGNLRKKSSNPSSDTDGTIISGKYIVGSSSRTSASGTGSQSITGLGFTPRLIKVEATDQVENVSIGESDGTTSKAVYRRENAGSITWRSSNNLVFTDSSGNTWTGALSSFDSDGFTINWTKSGSPNDLTFHYTCYA